LSFPRATFATYTAGEKTPNLACDPIWRLVLPVLAAGLAARGL
jgi:hypothetical protein